MSRDMLYDDKNDGYVPNGVYNENELTERQLDYIKSGKNKGRGNGIDNKKTRAYMAQENVQKFNKEFIPKALTGRPYKWDSVDELQDEIVKFLDLCDRTATIPTITSIATWLHCDRDTIYNHANNPNSPFFGILKNVINVCHSYLENGAVDGKVNSVLYMFMSKNYFGLKDDKNITVTPATNTDTNTPATMEALQKQIELENVANAEYTERLSSD